jgi:hypothetical protein
MKSHIQILGVNAMTTVFYTVHRFVNELKIVATVKSQCFMDTCHVYPVELGYNQRYWNKKSLATLISFKSTEYSCIPRFGPW